MDIFFTEDDYNEFSFNPSFEETLRLYADKSKLPVPENVQDPQLQKKTNPLASPKPGVFYPHFSSLTEGLVRYYNYLYNKFLKDGKRVTSEAEAKERKELEVYHAKLQKDQQEFQQFMETVARSSPQDYMVQFDGCKDYIEMLFQVNRERIKQYPQFYCVAQTVSLNPGQAVVSDPILTLVHPAKYSTNIPLAVLPFKDEHQCYLNSVASLMTDDLEDQLEKDKNPSSSSQTADVIISMAALETLIDNHTVDGFANEWEIPFEVLETPKEDKSVQKTIFFGEPFTKKNYYSHEANQLYTKNLLRVFLLNKGQNVTWKKTQPNALRVFPQQPNIPENPSDDIFEADSVLSELETFGTSVNESEDKETVLDLDCTKNVSDKSKDSPTKSPDKSKDGKGKSNDDLSTNSLGDKERIKSDGCDSKADASANQATDSKPNQKGTESVIDNIMKLSNLFHRRKSADKPSTEISEAKPQTSPNKTKAGLKPPQKGKDVGKSVESKSSHDLLDDIMKEQQDYMENNKRNVTKRRDSFITFVEADLNDDTPISTEESQVLWKLGKLRILVKTKVDSILRDKLNTHKFYPVTMHPKLEYQHWFGYEQVSASEQAKVWLSLYMLPGSKVIRGRINAQTSEVLMWEVFDIQDTPKYSSCFSPGQAMKLLHSIFNKLLSLSDGQYLLAHSPGVVHASIYNSVQSKNFRSKYDLHSSHEGAKLSSQPPPKIPWAPIDPGLFPPWHDFRETPVRCIFPPVPPKDPNKRPSKEDADSPTKKKRKKKKKRKLGNFV